jgi:Protein of unknown function (DUF1761)
MQIVAVFVAALAAFAFGAVYYGALSKPWMAASGVRQGADGKPANGSSPTPYVIFGVAVLVVAGMMRHVFAMSGLDSFVEGLMGGIGIGLFFITPWIAMNNGFAMRPAMLTVIDGGYAAIGCGIIGVVLTLF